MGDGQDIGNNGMAINQARTVCPSKGSSGF
jgi:hypothetical protein